MVDTPPQHGGSDEAAETPLTHPLEFLTRSQRAALDLTGRTFNTLVETSRAGVTNPQELIRQMTDLVGAVGDLAGATTQPLADFVAKQRELADTMAGLARMHADMAELVAAVAQRHADVVEAMERLSAPVLSAASKASFRKEAPPAGS